jgi:hypothetical protein
MAASPPKSEAGTPAALKVKSAELAVELEQAIRHGAGLLWAYAEVNPTVRPLIALYRTRLGEESTWQFKTYKSYEEWRKDAEECRSCATQKVSTIPSYDSSKILLVLYVENGPVRMYTEHQLNYRA